MGNRTLAALSAAALVIMVELFAPLLVAAQAPSQFREAEAAAHKN